LILARDPSNGHEVAMDLVNARELGSATGLALGLDSASSLDVNLFGRLINYLASVRSLARILANDLTHDLLRDPVLDPKASDTALTIA
jgi:class 3 adenylate cyclase